MTEQEAAQTCPYPTCVVPVEADRFCPERQVVMERFLWMLGHVKVQGRLLLEAVGAVAQSQALARTLGPKLHAADGGLLRRP